MVARLGRSFSILILLTIHFQACTTTKPEPTGGPVAATTIMKASYYADSFHGKTTSKGEIYDRKDFTAAHRTLPFGTKLRITNPVNGKSVVVRVNDRGPFKKGRDLDLSYAAAEEVGILKDGVQSVQVEILPTNSESANSQHSS